MWVQEEPTPIEPGEPLETYLRTVCLKGHLELLPPGEREAFVQRVAELLPRPEIDYVRLNIRARMGRMAAGGSWARRSTRGGRIR